MSDGAHMGIGPNRALETILGGAPPPEVTDPSEQLLKMRADILAAPRASDPKAMSDYETCAMSVAREILEWAWANFERFSDDERVVYDAMKADGVPLQELGLTGFQWGWAFNAARAVMSLPPVPNPAIVTVAVDESEES